MCRLVVNGMPNKKATAAKAPEVLALLSRAKRFEEKRGAILDAAAHLFNRKGLKGATFADIASHVGLITSSVTYYYRRKEDLATACLLRSLSVLDDLILAAAKAADDPKERLRHLLDLYFEYLAAIARGERAEIVNFKDTRALTSPHVETVFRAYTDMFRKLRQLLAPAGLEPPAANANAHLVISLMHNARNWIGRYESQDYRRVARRMSDMLLNGLAARNQKWRPPTESQLIQAVTENVSPDAFLRAATRLINDQGYRGASVEKIAALLKVTKGSFYHHNENKDDLVAACLRHSFAVIAAQQVKATEAGGTGWARLCETLGALSRLQVSPEGPLLRLTAFSALPEILHAGFAAELERVCERFANLLVEGMIDGSIRPVDPAIVARLLYAAIDAAAELQRWVIVATEETAPELYIRPLLVGIFERIDGCEVNSSAETRTPLGIDTLRLS